MATTSHVEHELLSKLIDELKVKANSDPEADVLAGRLLHRLKAESVTHTVAEYLEVFSDKFYDEEFFQMHRDELETRTVTLTVLRGMALLTTGPWTTVVILFR